MQREAVRITTDEDRERRVKELEQQDEREANERERKRKNHDFTQVYPKGWERIRKLVDESPAGLYALLAEHIDPSCGAVIADQGFLADKLHVNRRTISRWLKLLEDQGALVRIPVAGRVCAYCLDPTEVWKGYSTSKPYAAFYAKTLTGKDGVIMKRLKAMLKAKNAPETAQNDQGLP